MKCEVCYNEKDIISSWSDENICIECFCKKFNDETPIEIQCPHCDETLTVYHLDWSGIVCLHCKEEINKEEGFLYF